VLLRNGEADPIKDEYARFEGIPYLHRVVGPDEGFKSTWAGTAGYNPAQQDLYERFPNYAAYLCIEDDCVLHTPGFDRWLLEAFDEFPGRVGLIELIDRSHTIHVTAHSAEWCSALGWLCCPEVGEQAFRLSLRLASAHPPMYMAGAGAQFTHMPCVRAYGYTGNERQGAIEQPEVVRNFFDQEAALSAWIDKHFDEYKCRLMNAVGNPTWCTCRGNHTCEGHRA
jgi:hypothetical protein